MRLTSKNASLKPPNAWSRSLAAITAGAGNAGIRLLQPRSVAGKSGLRLWASLLILFLVSIPAHAHGPTRQKVTETIEINASVEAVWELVKNFGDAHLWLPMVQSSQADAGNEPGSIRTLILEPGVQVVEKLKSYNADKMTYKYRIPDATHDVKILPVNNYSSTIKVAADAGGDKTIVTWKGAFYRGYPNNDPPPELNDETAVAAVTALYKAGLAGLKEVAERQN